MIRPDITETTIADYAELDNQLFRFLFICDLCEVTVPEFDNDTDARALVNSTEYHLNCYSGTRSHDGQGNRINEGLAK